LLLLAFVSLQLLPLPLSLLRLLSPAAANIWAGADRVSSLLGSPAARAHPLSIDPAATVREWFRLLALFATFQSAALLVRTHWHRIAFGVALIAAAWFEFLYGVNEAALRRYAIWGWKNTLIFNRVTGTFVNPNHFAHYLAIIFPVSLFLAAWAWHRASPGAPFARRVARLLEKNLLPFGIGVIGAIGCVAAILMAQSRGGLLALFCGLVLVTAIAMGRTHSFRASRRRRVLFAVGGIVTSIVVIVSLVAFLGSERTVKRFVPNEGETITLVGRTVGARIAFGVWQQFPLFGSGAGTFAGVSSIAQRDTFENLFDHAHDDYLELAATTGAAGFVIAIVTLLSGYWSLVRVTLGDGAGGSVRRRLFQTAALTSISVAIAHALFDFNFFIPANSATLAAIAGAAAALHAGSFDADATADRVTRHRIREAHVDSMHAR
jgi:O-antigen ligase